MRTMLVVAAAAWLHVRVRNRRPASGTMDKVTQALLLLLFACSAATIVAELMT